eukprot:9089574-Lingulodinium_polyedra.AAC.1
MNAGASALVLQPAPPPSASPPGRRRPQAREVRCLVDERLSCPWPPKVPGRDLFMHVILELKSGGVEEPPDQVLHGLARLAGCRLLVKL